MRRNRLKIAFVLLLLMTLSACIVLPDFVGQKRAGKYEPSPTESRPLAQALTPIAERQTEPHTCGLHAMRSMYVAYGLDPDDFELRFRLGTDQPAIRADSTSTGTLHSDLYRVLSQDGFQVKPVDFDATHATEALSDHLASQQLALALVDRGTYHWVLLGSSDRPEELLIIDSLEDEVEHVEVADFIAEALSITLVQPVPAGESEDTASAHSRGLAEMSRSYQRRQ